MDDQLHKRASSAERRLLEALGWHIYLDVQTSRVLIVFHGVAHQPIWQLLLASADLNYVN